MSVEWTKHHLFPSEGVAYAGSTDIHRITHGGNPCIKCQLEGARDTATERIIPRSSTGS